MRAILWTLGGLALWLLVHDLCIFIPGPFWFPSSGVVVMGVLTGVLGYVWERIYEYQYAANELRIFLSRPLCSIAWLGGGLFGLSTPYRGMPSVGLNLLLDGMTGVVATWALVCIMLRWRDRPWALFGVVAIISIAGTLLPIAIFMMFFR